MEPKPLNKKSFLFTIGHSNHAMEDFLDLLRHHKIQVLIDIRSQPYSKHVPQFNRKELEAAVKSSGIKYLFLGRELGGRPEGEEFYDAEGYVLYNRLADSPLFLEGISRLEEGIRKGFRIALMCSEEDPKDCHWRLLVARVLSNSGIEVYHLRSNGNLEIESTNLPKQRLINFTGSEETDQWKSTRSVLPGERPPSFSES